MVAQERGAKFEPDREGGRWWVYGLWRFYGRGAAVAEEALEDVAEWLGFNDTEGYLLALDREKATIFDRATY